MRTSVGLCFLQLGLHSRVRQPVRNTDLIPTCTEPTQLPTPPPHHYAPLSPFSSHPDSYHSSICGCLIQTALGLQALFRPASWVTPLSVPLESGWLLQAPSWMLTSGIPDLAPAAMPSVQSCHFPWVLLLWLHVLHPHW